MLHSATYSLTMYTENRERFAEQCFDHGHSGSPLVHKHDQRVSNDFLLNVTVLEWHVRHKLVWNYILLCFENDLIATVDICCLFPFRAMSHNMYVQYLTHSYTLVNVYCSLNDSPPHKKVLGNILKCFRHNKFKRQG